jgi:hypothetical protein
MTPAQILADNLRATIDHMGYVPCAEATAARNATITDVYGVACYSKTDICPPPRPDGAHDVERPTSAPAPNVSQG